MANLNNKVVWVTGASSGIGEAVARQLCERGVRLIISARNRETLEKVRASCTHPDKVHVIPLDLSDPDSLEKKAGEALAIYGRVDVLIMSGGISQRSFALDTVMDVNRQLMEVNYFSSVTLTKALLPSMVENAWGMIVPVSSLVGKFGTPFRSGYSASKHALHGYFDSLRAEMWNKGIRVTIITPGFIRTNISVNAFSADGSATNKMDNAQARGMSADECATKMIRSIEREKEEVRIGGKETIGVLLKRYFPRIFSRMVRKAKVR